MITEETYAEAVAAAAADLIAGDDHNWGLARRTYERTRDRGGRQTSDGLVSMERWCTDVRKASGRRFSIRTGHRYKQAWQWYLDNSANLAEFPSFDEVMYGPDQEPPPLRRTRTEAAKERVTRDIDRLDAAAKVAALDRLMLDKEVRQEVQRQQANRKGQQSDAKERNKKLFPVLKTLEHAEALNSLHALMLRFIRDSADVLPRIDPDHYQRNIAKGDSLYTGEMLKAMCAKMRTVIDRVEGWLDTGNVGGDVDAFFKRVLEESRGLGGGGETAA